MSTAEIEAPTKGRFRRAATAILNGDGRQLRHYAIRAGLNPEFAYPTARVLQFMRHPDAYVRRRLAQKLIHRNPVLDGVFDRGKGYGIIPMGAVPGFDAMAATLRRLKEERAPKITGDYYIKNIFEPEDMARYPEVRDFVLSHEIIQLASDYLGAVPVLMTVQGWYTPQNNGLASSQLFHRDGIDYRQAKFVFNIADMPRSYGPFEFLPADISEHISTKLKKWRGRLTDEKIFEFCKPSDVVSTAGPAGAGFAVDGCRCFHYGGRAREGERLVLMISFGSYYSAMRAAQPVTGGEKWYPGDTLRQLVLGAA